MSDFVEVDFLTPKQTALLLEIYEAACGVLTEFPDGHVASLAARKIIDAFSSETFDGMATCRRTAPAMIGTA